MSVNRNLLPLSLDLGETRDPQISCERCPGACCRKGVILELTNKEVAFLTRDGTKVEEADSPPFDQDVRKRRVLGKRVLDDTKP